MKVAVQLTFEEFDEASAAVRGLQIEKHKRKERWSPATFITVIVFVVAFVPGLSAVETLDKMPHLRPHWYSILLVFAPVCALFMFAAVSAVAQRTTSIASFTWRLMLAMLPLIAIVLVVGGLTYLLGELVRRRTPAASATPPDWYGALVPHAVWLFVTAVVLAMLVRAVWSRNRQAWEAQPGVARPQVFDITSAGVAIDEAVLHRRYQWGAFVRFIETPNLLLLCPSYVTFEIIPKRCFETPDDMAAVRTLFQREIRDPTTESAAFPVLPATPVAPSEPPPLPQRGPSA